MALEECRKVIQFNVIKLSAAVPSVVAPLA
jgi:hypothetical protein